MQQQQQQQSQIVQSLERTRRCAWYQYLKILINSFTVLLIIACFVSLFLVYLIYTRKSKASALSYSNITCNRRSCGCPNYFNGTIFIPKIVGGQSAPAYIYPWLVALTDRHRTEPFCAGFIISSTAILTAAHCLTNRKSNQVQVLSKLHDIKSFRGDRHDIDNWIIHPTYQINDPMHLNDIAIIKVKRPFAKDLQPCCLPLTESDVYPRAKTQGIVSGWGKVAGQPDTRSSPVLQHVAIPIVDHKNYRCRRVIADSARQLCAGYDDLPIDACSGDSGSPLLTVESDDDDGDARKYFVAAGIVSYGNKQCDSSISSGVYTRISFYVDWISKSLEN